MVSEDVQEVSVRPCSTSGAHAWDNVSKYIVRSTSEVES